MALEGTLQDMPFTDLFDVFRAGRRSGRLLVSHDEERGLIFIGAGQLLDAVLVTDIEGTSAAYAEEAVIRILGWSAASFVFEHDPTVTQRPRRILRDVAWFFTAIAREPRPAVSLRSRLRPLMPGQGEAVGPVTLSGEEWRLLGALWAQPTLSMACVELEREAHQMLPLAQSLVDRGLLAIVEESETPRPTLRAAERSLPVLRSPALHHSPHQHPVPPPRSQLLQAIIRRVRTL
jgi:hypothetical protein